MLTLHIPESVEKDLALSEADLEAQIRLMAALKMFELNMLSLEQATQLAGLSIKEFVALCGRYQISALNYFDEMQDGPVDALAELAGLAQPLGPSDLARNFDTYTERLQMRTPPNDNASK